MTIRRILLAIFLIGTVGMLVELLLIEHTDDLWQWAPLVLLSLSLGVIACDALVKRTFTRRILQLTMILFILSGLIGVGLHYKAKIEFKMEANPGLSGIELVQEAIKGASLPPILAPGMMIHLGLIGLAYTATRSNKSRINKESFEHA